MNGAICLANTFFPCGNIAFSDQYKIAASDKTSPWYKQ